MATKKNTDEKVTTEQVTTEQNLAEIKALLQQLTAQNEGLRAENEKLRDDIETKKSQPTEKSAVDSIMQMAVARMSEKVPVKLFKDNGKYKDDLVVQLAGVAYQIKRGITVMVPRAVYDIIRRSELQDQHTANMLDTLQQEYAEKNK